MEAIKDVLARLFEGDEGHRLFERVVQEAQAAPGERGRSLWEPIVRVTAVEPVEPDEDPS